MSPPSPPEAARRFHPVMWVEAPIQGVVQGALWFAIFWVALGWALDEDLLLVAVR